MMLVKRERIIGELSVKAKRGDVLATKDGNFKILRCLTHQQAEELTGDSYPL